LDDQAGQQQSFRQRAFATLENPTFRTLWIGSVLSFLGFFTYVTGQSVVAFDLTDDNSAVGIVVFSMTVAMLAFGPLGGALADRLSKRELLFVTQFASGAVFLAVGLLIQFDQLTLALLAGAAFLVGVFFTAMAPVRQAYVGDIVTDKRRGNAVALIQVARSIGQVAGPFIAGGLIAWEAAGADVAFYVMTAMYVAASIATLPLPKTRSRASGSGVFRDAIEGFVHVWDVPRLHYLILQLLFVMLIGFNYVTILPGFVEDDLGHGDAATGLMFGVAALGGLVASFTAAAFADSGRAYQLLALCGLLLGAGLVVVSAAPNLAVAALVMLFAGAGAGGFQTLNGALMVRESEPAYYGRVMAILMMTFSGFGIAALPLGFLADAIGPRYTLLAIGLWVTVVALTYTARSFDLLRGRGVPAAAPPPAEA
jgi:MFS family permease